MRAIADSSGSFGISRLRSASPPAPPDSRAIRCPLGSRARPPSSAWAARPIRFWGDQLPPNADAMVKEKWAQVRATRAAVARRGKASVVTFLAISGGGADGAFGAGVLTGWTARGNRPEFDVVTGVSTGALTAPFAFLGPRYDEALKAVFTESTTGDIAIARPVRGLIGGDSLASNAPLAGVVAHYVTPAVPVRGRRRASEGPAPPDRHHQSRRAAPGDLGHGQDRHDRHAGGARSVPQGAACLGGDPGRVPAGLRQGRTPTAPSMTRCMSMAAPRARCSCCRPSSWRRRSTRRSASSPIRRVYIIRNGRVDPEWKAVKARTLSIAGRVDLHPDQEPGHRRSLRALHVLQAERHRLTTSSTSPATSPTRARRPSIPST